MPLSAAQYRMRRLFTEDFNAADIASPLLSFDAVRTGTEVRAVLEAAGVRVAGVRVAGSVAGYIHLADLTEAPLSTRIRAFAAGEVIPYTAGFHDVLAALSVYETVFVAGAGGVTAVIGRTDLQSPPMRMWLFGLITILDAFVTRELATRFPGDSWTGELSAGRLEKARALLEERTRRNQATTLIECLQFSDKAGILMRDAQSREAWGLDSKRTADRLIADLQSLRNHLAHTQDILTYDWDTILKMAQRLDDILARV